MNILYIGSSGALSLVPFKKILASEYTVSAVGIYHPLMIEQRIIALENESLALSAQQQQIPVIDLSQLTDKRPDQRPDQRPEHRPDQLLEQLKALKIDLILMSCYGRRLPEKIINLAPAGCFNMHPSLLPRYRGPEPVFWQMKAASEMGVSWHLVTQDLDAGDIVKQQKIKLDEGMSFSQITQLLADTGAELMLTLLSELSQPASLYPLQRKVQDETLASYYPYPDQRDFAVDTAWSAAHAYNFMRATQAFGHDYYCKSGRYEFFLEQALDYDNNATLTAVEVQGNRLYIPFKEGVLTATYTGKLSS